MAVTIDTLQLDIQAADASGAVSSLRKLATALTKFSAALDKLNVSKMKQFSSALRQLSASSANMSGAIASTGKLASSFSRTNKVLGATTSSANQFGASSLRSVLSFGKMALAARFVARGLEYAIGKSNEYVENLNLFTVAMGEYADEAKAYAEQVQNIMGVDSSDWMRSQGIFNTLLTGFGMANQEAAFMSKNLTQLGYDISSFFNISVSDAMLKLESGIAGELEPLRRLGWDLSQAKLQAVAMANGIDKSVQSMTQAEKAQLRYVAIMTQVTTAQGDMARTLDSPANQLRILQAQLNLAARALGNIFIPALNAVLPAAIAFLQVIRAVAEGIATLFGFSLPEFDYSGITGAASAASDLDNALGGAGGSAKELKGQLAKFDELNVISQTSGGGGGGGGGALSSLFDGLELPGYDFLGDAQDRIANIRAELEKVLPIVAAIGAALLAWKFPVLGLALDFGLVFSGVTDILEKGFSKEALIKILLGVLVGTIGGWAITGSLAGGLAIGVGIAVVATLAAIYVKLDKDYKEQIKQQMKDAFGTITLTSAESQELAKALLTTSFSVKVTTLYDQATELAALKTKIQDTVDDLNVLTYKVNIGAKLSPDEITGFQSLVSQYTTQLNDYITKSGYFVNLAIQLGDLGGEELSGAVGELTSGNITYIEELGRQANKYFSEAFSEDGLLTNWDSYKEAQKYLAKMEEVQRIIDQSEKSKMQLELELSWSGKALTPESYTQFQQDLNAFKTGLTKKAQETVSAEYANLQIQVEVAKLWVSSDPDNVDAQAALAAAQKALQDKSTQKLYALELQNVDLQVSSFAYNTMQNTMTETVNDVFAKVKPSIGAATAAANLYDEMYANLGVYSVAFTERSASVINDALTRSFAEQFGRLPEETKTLITTMVDSGATAAVDNLKRLKSLPKVGETATLEMVDGLNTYNTAAAMRGEVNAVWYLVGKHFAESPDYLKSLDTVKNLAEGLNDSAKEGLAANLDSITEGVDGSISVIVDGVATQFPRVTQALYDNFAALGIDLRDYVKDIPSGIDTSLTDAFKRQNFNQSIAATLTINTAVKENIVKMDVKTKAGQSYSVSLLNDVGTGSVMEYIKNSIAASGFATGGFPTSGQMFIANENGAPEMVGSFGNRTAVANNDQIVEGIASGVATANQEQNALLREQNALLRAILDKDDGLEPSPAWGAFMEQSSRLYAKAGGR